jgi:hypothetical protein
MRRKRFALARRYGHASMAQVHSATADLRKLARDNAAVTAGVLGAAAGAVSSELGVGTAALVGAVAGVAIEMTLKK